MATGMSVVFSRVGAETANLVCFSADHPVIQSTIIRNWLNTAPPYETSGIHPELSVVDEYSVVQFCIPSTAQKNRLGASTRKYI